MANRHLSRVIVMQTLFEWDFRSNNDLFEMAKRNIDAYSEECDIEYIETTLAEIQRDLVKIDKIIAQAAPEWPIEQIAIIDKSILRVSVYELMFADDIPPKVIINEAVELGKTYGSENSYRFINGVLGTLYKNDPRYLEESQDNEEIKRKLSLLDLHDTIS